MAIPHTRSFSIAIIIALFVTTALYVFNQSNIAPRLERLSYDSRLSLSRAEKYLPAQISILLIDEASLRLMDPVVGRWPWPRAVYKDLINYISAGGPKAIIFDILFSERQLQLNQDDPAGTPGDDQLLIQATAQQHNVHHAIYLDTGENPTDPGSPVKASKQLTDRHALGESISKALPNRDNDSAESDYHYFDIIPPIDGLIEASGQLGIVNATTDGDGVYRRARLFFHYDGYVFPALSIAPLVSERPHRQTILDRIQATYASDPDDPGTIPINIYSDYHPVSVGKVLNSISKFYKGNTDQLDVPASAFSGKYVFIGSNAAGLHDLKATPNMELTPGVFIHAAVLGNVISNDFLLPVDIHITMALILLAALLTSLSVILIKRTYLQIALPLSLLVGYLAVCVYAMQHNIVLNLTLPVLAILNSGFLAYIVLFATEKKEKRRIKHMFSRYVSPAALSVMVDEFHNYKTAGHGSEETVSVLFSDIRNFTGLAENLEARQVVAILNRYFSVMTDVVFKHCGTIDKFIGDAIMATWGAPIASEQHALNAVRAAIDMYYAVDKVNDWLIKHKLGNITIGIGIHTGTAILGSIGSQQKADYTVIGDTVNLSSRLEGITKLYQVPIILSETCYAGLDAQIPCQLLDRVRVKGKQQAVEIYTPILYGAGHIVTSKQEAMIWDDTSRQAFRHYQTRQWVEALVLLESLPLTYRNTVLIERCKSLLDTPPQDAWEAVSLIDAK